MSNIFAFCCENSINSLNEEGVKVIKLPCAGRLDVSHILKAFEHGADGVLIFSCYEGACKFISGNVKTKKRISYAKKLLKEIGIEEDRLQMHSIQANQEGKLKEVIQNFKNKTLKD